MNNKSVTTLNYVDLSLIHQKDPAHMSPLVRGWTTLVVLRI